jgi:hypothetical protein
MDQPHTVAGVAIGLHASAAASMTLPRHHGQNFGSSQLNLELVNDMHATGARQASGASAVL